MTTPTSLRSTLPRAGVIVANPDTPDSARVSELTSGLTGLGYEVYHLFFFRKSESFDAPPNTIYCWPRRPGNPWALSQFLWQLGRQVRQVRPDAVLTFQHYGNVIGGAVSRLVSRAPLIANQVSSSMSMNWAIRAADIVMGGVGFFKVITLNSRQMEREYARYPASYRSRMRYVAHGFDDKSLNVSKQEARSGGDRRSQDTAKDSGFRCLTPSEYLRRANRTDALWPRGHGRANLSHTTGLCGRSSCVRKSS